jgi:hypothetical protein
VKIPKQIKLAGLTIQIVFDDTLIATRKIVGEACYNDQKILLDPTVSDEQLEQNFFHELLHWIFYIMGEAALRDNEKVVDLLSHFLHQALKDEDA